jgi:hypothetical protein
MVSRGEVGLIVTAMGASAGIFKQTEVAVMVSVVLLTTLLTPLALRGAFQLRCAEDEDDQRGNMNNLLESAVASLGPLEAVDDTEDLDQPKRYARADQDLTIPATMLKNILILIQADRVARG